MEESYKLVTGSIWSNKKYLLILFMTLFLGSFLRFYQLGQKSLWTDELATMMNATNIVDIKTFLAHTHDDDLPKFYSVLLKFWMKLGVSEFSMRSLSVIFGCLSILATYALCRLFFDIKTSLSAAFLTATSPFLLLYDREIRMYSLFGLLSMLSTYYFIRSLRDNKKAHWILYAIVNILNIYTHYYAFMTIGVQWLYIIIRNRSYRHIIKPWIIANAVMLLFFIMRIAAVISDVLYFSPWAIPRERFPFIFGKEVVEFFYIFFSMSVGQTILPWNPFAAPIFIAVLACFFIAIKKGLILSQDILYLVLLTFLPIIIGLVFRISLPRYFTFIAPVFFILAARGLWLLPKKIVAIGALVIIFGWSYGLANYYDNKEFHMMGTIDPWKDVARFLKENVKEN
jgi:uncharacterized membrane protein